MVRAFEKERGKNSMKNKHLLSTVYDALAGCIIHKSYSGIYTRNKSFTCYLETLKSFRT